jgi:hypothetical protein
MRDHGQASGHQADACGFHGSRISRLAAVTLHCIIAES